MKLKEKFMTLERDTLLKIVTATRQSFALADEISKIIGDQNPITRADEIAGMLADVLFMWAGEYLRPDQSFNDSQTSKLLKSKYNDEVVTDMIIIMHERNRRSRQTPEGEWI